MPRDTPMASGRQRRCVAGAPTTQMPRDTALASGRLRRRLAGAPTPHVNGLVATTGASSAPRHWMNVLHDVLANLKRMMQLQAGGAFSGCHSARSEWGFPWAPRTFCYLGVAKKTVSSTRLCRQQDCIYPHKCLCCMVTTSLYIAVPLLRSPSV